MNIKTVTVGAILGFCAAVPVLASAGESLTRESRGLSAETAPIAVKERLLMQSGMYVPDAEVVHAASGVDR